MLLQTWGFPCHHYIYTEKRCSRSCTLSESYFKATKLKFHCILHPASRAFLSPCLSADLGEFPPRKECMICAPHPYIPPRLVHSCLEPVQTIPAFSVCPPGAAAGVKAGKKERGMRDAGGGGTGKGELFLVPDTRAGDISAL